MVGSNLHKENLWFGPFRLDPALRVLVREQTTVALRPKTLKALLVLLRHVGEVVSKDELLTTVWEGAAVSEYVLTTCISELRAALGEDSKHPRFLKTIHGRGYQLVVAEVHTSGLSTRATNLGSPTQSTIVGRDRELQQLGAAMGRALAGQRQIVFLSGEMGIGKTTLADEFLRLHGGSVEALHSAPSSARPSILVARGQCIEQFGAGEPYMPVFEAIGRLGREVSPAYVVDVLRQRTPTWLIQIPGLLPPDQRAELRRELPAETQEHMLRLIADGIEALSEQRLLVLVLEDLHLSDRATLELLMTLALRRSPARLLIAGTFRSAEDYPGSALFQTFKQQLLLHRQCEEIALGPLSHEAVETYLVDRFVGLHMPAGLAATVHARTEGNPLFIGRLVDQLLEDGLLGVDPLGEVLRADVQEIGRHVPPSLRAMIEQRTDTLAADQREILETASVAGVHFWSAALATALERNREEVEAQCTQLSRRHGFLVAAEEPGSDLPDLGARYQFNHALYQQVLYERIEVTRRQRLHRSIGTALRQAWGRRADEIAAELASHFERGADLAVAIEFYDKAAVAAANQGANREAVRYLDRGLSLLGRTEDDPRRPERELELLMTRGPSVLAAAGYGSLEVLENYRRALELARQLDNPMRQMSCLLALSICEQTRANLPAGEEFALELIRVAQQMQLPQPLVAQLQNPLSQVRMHSGAVAEAVALADAAVAGSDLISMPLAPPDARPALWAEPRVMLHCQRAAASVSRGLLAQAGRAIEQALRIAHEVRHPFNIAYATCYAALYEDTLGHFDAAIRLAESAIALTHTYEFPFWEGVAKIFYGHALACSTNPAEGTRILREGFDLWHGTGARLATTMHSNMLAEAYLAAKDVPAAEAALHAAEEHAEQTGERVFLAETLRLQAECLRCRGAGKAEQRQKLQRAAAISRKQGTKLWELRATLELHRLGSSSKSRRALEEICRAFADEPTTREIAEVRAIVAA